MRPYAASLVATIAFTCSLAANPLPATAPRSEIVETTIDAPSLEGNLLGDPVRQGVAVYLPPSYRSSTDRRYPVLYLLHGIADSYRNWTQGLRIGELIDEAIAQGRIPEMIVVMPNGRNALLGSFYLNSPVIGNWEDFIGKDLVAWTDREYRTVAQAGSRAIAGHSMGGFGAITLGMDHPDVFSVVYAMSPCCLDAVEDVAAGNVHAWRAALTFKSRTDIGGALERGDFYPVAVVGMCSAMLPDPGHPPLDVDFPYRAVRGEIVPDEPTYTRWRKAFPIRRIDSHDVELKKLRGLALDYGIDDQFPHVPVATLAFSQALGAHRIPHTLEVYEGDHREAIRDRLAKVVLPWIGRALRPGP